jgi:hypothetical protein
MLMVPVGLAGPLIMPPITPLLLNSVPDAQADTASGVFNTRRQVGGASRYKGGRSPDWRTMCRASPPRHSRRRRVRIPELSAR